MHNALGFMEMNQENLVGFFLLFFGFVGFFLNIESCTLPL